MEVDFTATQFSSEKQRALTHTAASLSDQRCREPMRNYTARVLKHRDKNAQKSFPVCCYGYSANDDKYEHSTGFLSSLFPLRR